MSSSSESRLQQIIDHTHDQLLAVLLPTCKDRAQCDDIIQETYIRLWQHLDKVKDDATILALLKKYARNIFLDELRKMASRHTAMAQLSSEHPMAPSAAAAMEGKEYAGYIQAAINKLPRQQQLIFRLHKEQAMSYKQIALQLNISINTIEKQMGRALKVLRHELGPLYYADKALVLTAMYYAFQ